ncbi:MAG: CRISPR-associated endonuclease Cas3'', partial [Rhodoferax sp.]|nr:CRISPR-associated endonuclease Cas3'' [Rhodoferax sp.]
MQATYAHSGGHLLVDHLQAVSELAEDLADDGKMTCGSWARLAGLWHDLGKYRPGFQRYLRGHETLDAHIEGKVAGREKTHSAAGALWAIETLEASHGARGKLAARALAYVIAGHHAGLDDWHHGLHERLSGIDAQTELREAKAAQPPAKVMDAGNFDPDLTHIPGGRAGFALWVRMIFSCLVDADFLDTEAHFDSSKPARREGFPSIAQMRVELTAYLDGLISNVPASEVNAHRARV